MSKRTVLADYEKYKGLTVKSDKLRDMVFYVGLFVNFKKKDLDSYTENDLLDFLNSISSKYKVSSMNNIKAYLKNFIRWYYVDWSARFRNLDKYCRSNKPDEAFNSNDMISEEDFKKFIQTEESHFWKAYFMTLFYGGCRPIEVSRLRWIDIEEDESGGGYMTIYSNKNKTSFLKYLPSDVMFYVNKLKNNNSEWVFINERTKKPVTKKGAYWECIRVSKIALNRHVNLLQLRHSIATINYNKEWMKDDDVAKQMGHTKSMKNVYVKNNKEKLKEIAKKIYISPEELPKERKHELELRIEKLEKHIEKTGLYLEAFVRALEGNEIVKKANEKFKKNPELYDGFLDAMVKYTQTQK